jgi:hypothetical protein
MRFVCLTFLIAMLGLFKVEATPEQEFWSWFQKNEASLFSVATNQEVIFDRLTAEMQKINKALTFEFGPVENGKREFVISADGIKDAFPDVERLYASAPKLERWFFIKFRPRRIPMDIQYNGVKVKADDVYCTVESDRSKAGITVFIRGYQPDGEKNYKAIAFLMLDQALGEYDVETKVGFIEVKPFSAESGLEKKPLKDVTTVFDDFWKNQASHN